MIGRLHHLVIDCPDPAALARFYAALLGQPITYRSLDFIVVAKNDHSSGLAFQRARELRAPRWPDPQYPQQMHLDVMVEDLAVARTQVLALGAVALEPVPEPTVFADPAGHPFCLISRPGWAEPVGS
ncbi:VOC family protein [Specibacter sp. NPDC078709]|uniref:VOC family protein n=1 Tax=Specibacter sp. NPDC078709 TaxID=3154364 RepID=UPI003449E63D